MIFKALIGTVVSNESATVKFEELLYETSNPDEIKLLKDNNIQEYGVVQVEEPKSDETEDKVETEKVETEESETDETEETTEARRGRPKKVL